MPQSGSGGTQSGSVPSKNSRRLPIVDGRTPAHKQAAELEEWRQKKAEKEQGEKAKREAQREKAKREAEAEERAINEQMEKRQQRKEEKKARMEKMKEEKRTAEQEKAEKEKREKAKHMAEQKSARHEQREKEKREAAEQEEKARNERIEQARQNRAKQEQTDSEKRKAADLAKAKKEEIDRAKREAAASKESQIDTGSKERERRKSEGALKGKGERVENAATKQAEEERTRAIRAATNKKQRDRKTLKGLYQQCMSELELLPAQWRDGINLQKLQRILSEIGILTKDKAPNPAEPWDDLVRDDVINIKAWNATIALVARPGEHAKLLAQEYLARRLKAPLFLKTGPPKDLVWTSKEHLANSWPRVLTRLQDHTFLDKHAELGDIPGGVGGSEKAWGVIVGTKLFLFENSSDVTQAKLNIAAKFNDPVTMRLAKAFWYEPRHAIWHVDRSYYQSNSDDLAPYRKAITYTITDTILNVSLKTTAL